MNNLGFIVDTKPLEDESVLNASARKFPSFRKSWIGLGLTDKTEESEKSESENENDDTDEYYGKNRVELNYRMIISVISIRSSTSIDKHQRSFRKMSNKK